MLLRYFYNRPLAHASYLVGCQQARQVVIVDPGRDIDGYLEAAQREGVEIVAVAETHIHADYVSGARELAARVGAKLYVSDTGPAEWKYQYVTDYEHELLTDGDRFYIGKIQFEVMHTPGHTPESISFLLTDQGGGANRPMGIFTGDFVFVGSIGRPDLLEEAAGMIGTAEEGAHQLYQSIKRFRQLPDFLQIWPAHGAGSACGKGLGAIPSSTVGYEKLFNPALQFEDEAAFVRYILADQPEAPRYFAVMKRVNKEGPAVLGEFKLPPLLTTDRLPVALAEGTVIDLSASARYAEAHVPGTLNIPTSMLTDWAGWLVDYAKPVFLIAAEGDVAEAVRLMQMIGIDAVKGVFSPSAVHAAGLASEAYPNQTPEQLAERIAGEEVTLVDVRSTEEWNAGHIAQAVHHFLGKLPQTAATIANHKPLVTQCQSGKRSAIAASLLQAAGRPIINMTGGFAAWQKAGLPVVKGPECAQGVCTQA